VPAGSLTEGAPPTGMTVLQAGTLAEAVHLGLAGS